jgi:hypothetical protein
MAKFRNQKNNWPARLLNLCHRHRLSASDLGLTSEGTISEKVKILSRGGAMAEKVRQEVMLARYVFLGLMKDLPEEAARWVHGLVDARAKGVPNTQANYYFKQVAEKWEEVLPLLEFWDKSKVGAERTDQSARQETADRNPLRVANRELCARLRAEAEKMAGKSLPTPAEPKDGMVGNQKVPTSFEELDAMSWNAIQRMASAFGLKSFGVQRDDLVASLADHLKLAVPA